jgi:hypothetical protein
MAVVKRRNGMPTQKAAPNNQTLEQELRNITPWRMEKSLPPSMSPSHLRSSTTTTLLKDTLENNF